MSQKIRIKLKSYDHNLVDKSAEKIVKTVKSTGAVVTGPIPLPTRIEKYTVLKGPHIDKKSNIKYYAQELKENTYNLTRMNLVMRGILPDNIEMGYDGLSIKLDNIKPCAKAQDAEMARLNDEDGPCNDGTGQTS